MSEELLVRHCSPTLAGLKTANLFNDKFESVDTLKAKIEYMNNMLNSKGVYVCILKVCGDRALIYVFRPNKLKKDLSSDEAKCLLAQKGYRGSNIKEYVEHLAERIGKCSEFPHEIGLFLGYPLEDVKGFIENKGKNCKCSGCWKVYSNEWEAKKMFAKFKKCTDVYCRKLHEGLSILSLTIAA
ncbi:MAG: DUF3793 family protein [Clostridia bacterium]|nr:DUF3793 family protein [Clostridia bacterium]